MLVFLMYVMDIWGILLTVYVTPSSSVHSNTIVTLLSLCSSEVMTIVGPDSGRPAGKTGQDYGSVLPRSILYM